MVFKSKTFAGGYKFKRFEGFPDNELIEIPVPPRVIIPLKQGFGMEVPPIVKIGQSVKAGQVIGIDDNTISNPVHSSISGTVEAITHLAGNNKEIKAITIKSNGTPEWQPLSNYSAEWSKLTNEKLEKIIYLSGIASLGSDGIPTRYKSSVALPGDVRSIIVNGINSEVYNLSNSVLLTEQRIYKFVQGLKILHKIMPNAKILFALNRDQNDIIQELVNQIKGIDWINILTFNVKYPLDSQRVLVNTILKKKYPYYSFAVKEIGVLLLKIQTVLHIFEAVTKGKPLIEKIIALCGSGFNRNMHIKIRLGTFFQEIIKNYSQSNIKQRIVANSLLTGKSINDLNQPIDRKINSIIAIPEDTKRRFLAFIRPGFRKDSYSNTFFSFLKKKGNTNMHGEQRPCIFCNYCNEACPVKILPFLIYQYVERDLIGQILINLKIFDCINCNLCSYICPSKIPVASFIKKGKNELLKQSEDFPSLKLLKINSKRRELYEEIK